MSDIEDILREFVNEMKELKTEIRGLRSVLQGQPQEQPSGFGMELISRDPEGKIFDHRIVENGIERKII